MITDEHNKYELSKRINEKKNYTTYVAFEVLLRFYLRLHALHTH